MKRGHKFKGEVGKIYGRVFEGGKERANFNDYIIISKRGKEKINLLLQPEHLV